MSQYGRLYEDASKARRRLMEALPGLVGTFTPYDAKRIVREEAAKLIDRVDQLANEWADIEAEMAKEPG